MSAKYNNQSQPTVALSYELFQSTITAITAVWTTSKLFSTKADKQTMLIINSKATYATLINTTYTLASEQPECTLESKYGKQFAQDVISRVMHNLLLG